MSGSILTALCYSFMWSTMYFTLCLINSKKSYEWHCRTVTAIHASVVSILSAWCGFVQGPWPFTHAGGPSTPLQLVTTEICLGYFLFDFTWCLYFRSEGLVMLVHHMVSIFGLTFSAVTGHYGTELIAAIFGSEATNPLLQMRWFLKETGKYNTLLGEIVDHGFVFMFGFLRIGIGSCLLYSYFQQDTDILGRLSGIVLYAISWMFWISIVQYAIRKYKKKFKKWAELADAKKQESSSSKVLKVNGHNELTNGGLCMNGLANDSLSNKLVSQTMSNGDLNFNTREIIEENGNGNIEESLNGYLHRRNTASQEKP
ncbi:transmembrane protein 136-like [Mizuhopecten yessoensis]|uniref:Transmembrane protein 136 n=1 Tax=Mizuhopecten yessoensis TaxID=6573 RepID=A0A210QUM0_MIZYE|nr:transmembrane protein 136-like [Mizuhopecten yessoensis]XP_021349423.1 transmembrane protein 136-like [Mizuhopecten yessoensis]XP_021349424.1 transmembrane protein 136-like [Mizuhopecten yessoensis]OWF52429.1 Transmembrane protein 136 [Mizuhopecten yessoensis]